MFTMSRFPSLAALTRGVSPVKSAKLTRMSGLVSKRATTSVRPLLEACREEGEQGLNYLREGRWNLEPTQNRGRGTGRVGGQVRKI